MNSKSGGLYWMRKLQFEDPIDNTLDLSNPLTFPLENYPISKSTTSSKSTSGIMDPCSPSNICNNNIDISNEEIRLKRDDVADKKPEDVNFGFENMFTKVYESDDDDQMENSIDVKNVFEKSFNPKEGKTKSKASFNFASKFNLDDKETKK